MDKGFPPYPVYPKKYDTDYTLFKVYNTTESVTTSPSEQYDTIIYIRPVGVNEPEIWPTNGYATISGEVLYYDEVGYDQYTNKINALKNCLRSIGGKKSQFNPAGTDIRGFVMAEHHNQLSRGLVNLENFIGNITTEDQKTLTWRINDLNNIPILLDDYGSPEVQFVCSIESIDPASGTTFNYTITILGTYTNFVLDFGDGTTEVNNLVGTHIYPPNYATNPILTINTPLTTLVLTCLSQTDQAATTISTNDFNDFLQPLPPAVVPLTFPDIPTFPDVVVPPFVPTPVNLNFPPIIFPSINIGPLGPINVPSIITIDPPIIIPSIIEFTNVPNIPSYIDITPINIPSVVTITPITFGSLGFSPLLIDTVDSVTKCYGQKTVVNADGSGDRLVKITVDNLTCNASDKVTRMSVKLEGLALAQRENPPAEYGLGEIAFLIQGPDGTTCLLWANAIDNYFRSGANSFDCTKSDCYHKVGNLANSAFVDLIFADDSNTYLPRTDCTLITSGTYHPSPNTLEDNINQSANIGICTSGSGFFYFDAPVSLPDTPWGTTLSVFNDKNPIGDWYVYILKPSQISGWGPVPAEAVPYLSINNICLNFAYQPDVCFTPSSPNNPNNPSFTPGTPIPPPTPIAPNVYPSFVPAFVPAFAPDSSPTIVPSMVPGFVNAFVPGEYPGFGPVIAPTVGPKSTPSGPAYGPTVGVTVGPVIIEGVQCVGSCIYECIGGIWTRTFNYCGSVAACVCPSSVGPCSPNISWFRIEMCGPEVGPAVTPFLAPFATPAVGPVPTPAFGPLITPGVGPLATPGVGPEVAPAFGPLATPGVGPLVTPSVSPAVGPFLAPDITPAVTPSTTPGLTPSVCPSATPSTPTVPGDVPAISLALERPHESFGLVRFGPAVGPVATPGTPCVVPGLIPSFAPSLIPDFSPAFGPHTTPSITPSFGPLITPGVGPLVTPEIGPLVTPDVGPTTTPSFGPITTPDVGPGAAPFFTPLNNNATTPLSPEAEVAGCDSDTANTPPPLNPSSTQYSSFCVGLCLYEYTSSAYLNEPGWLLMNAEACRIVNPRRDGTGNIIGSCLCQMPQYTFNYDPLNPWYEPFPPGTVGQKLCKKCYYRQNFDPAYPTPLVPFNVPNLVPQFGPNVGPLLIPSVAPTNAPQSAPNQENFCYKCLGYCQYSCIAGFMVLRSASCSTTDGRTDQGECCTCGGISTGLCDPRNPRTALRLERCVNINPSTPVSIPAMTPAELSDGYCVWKCIYNYRWRSGDWVAYDSTCIPGQTVCVEPLTPCNAAYENEVVVTKCGGFYFNSVEAQNSENQSSISLNGTETYDMSEKLKLLGDKIAPNLNHTLSVQEQKNNNQTVLPKNVKLTQDIEGICFNGKWVIDVCRNESDYNSLVLYEGEVCDNSIEKIGGYCFKIEKTTNENTDLEFKLNLVNSGNQSKTVSIVFTDKIIEDKLLKNEQITIIDSNSIDNFAVAKPPKTEDLNILYHEDKPKYDVKIVNEKNQEEMVMVTPVSSPININFNDSTNKDIKIKLQNTEEQKTELVNNLQVIDEIKKNTIFKDISEDEKIKSPLNE